MIVNEDGLSANITCNNPYFILYIYAIEVIYFTINTLDNRLN